MDLGPIAELIHALGPFKLTQFGIKSRKFDWLVSARCQGVSYLASPHAPYGFAKTAHLQSDDPTSTEFYMRAKRAAAAAGFSADYCGKITAAIGEFESNISEHSQQADSGYVAYVARQDCMEFVVADLGVGVLASLRSNPSFASLADAGTALELALTEGVSRHSNESARGYGFRPLLVGLANISDHIRIRSGDHSREFFFGDDRRLLSRTIQKPFLEGLFCYVSCSTNG